jgi:hypothetical protein
MKLGKIIFILLSGFIVSCSNNSGINNEWSKIIRESKTIDNITYYFPSEIDINKRNAAIKECQISITQNLELINETDFTNEMDVEFVESRKKMLKYAGMEAQGLAFPNRNTFFTVLNDDGSPIKHEMMHMITMYKWGIPPATSTWMNEGLATYSSSVCIEYTLSEIYKYLLQSEKLIAMNTLADNFYGNPEMVTYFQSAFICKYLIDNYGLEKFKLLWKNGLNELQSIYGFNKEQLEINLSEFVNKKHPTEIEFNWEKFNEGC